MKKRIQFRYIGLGLALLACIYAMLVFLPPAVDWRDTFRPAALALLSGQNPYSVEFFYNAPWTLIPFLPLALLPIELSRALLVLISLAGFGWTARRLGASPIGMGLILISPMVIHNLLNGNVEWMVVPAFVLPPQIGLFLLAVKPQVGYVVAIFWLVEAWRKGGWRQVVRVFAPITIALVLSILIFGVWPLKSGRQLDFSFRASFWPASIPVGLTLLVYAIRRNKVRFTFGASPLLSPYALFHSWVGALYAIADMVPELAAAVAGLWMVVIYMASQGIGF
jgi:hypothetical protein